MLLEFSFEGFISFIEKKIFKLVLRQYMNNLSLPSIPILLHIQR